MCVCCVFVFEILWGFLGSMGLFYFCMIVLLFLIKYFTPQIALSIINSSSSRLKGNEVKYHEVQ